MSDRCESSVDSGRTPRHGRRPSSDARYTGDFIRRSPRAVTPPTASDVCPRPALGVAIIALNAQTRLAQCLDALRFADKIVVVDGGSTDRTVDIALAHGALVISAPEWPGFGPQKNRAVEALDTDWILSIDTDEVVTPELAASIREAIRTPRANVYELDRLSNFCGRWMTHSGWRPDWVPRLFKRDTARFSIDLVHERLLFDGAATRLNGHLLHYSFDDFETVLRKINAYSSAGARQRLEAGRRQAGLGTAVRHGLWAFLKTYVTKGGFLDGRMGFILAVSNAEGAYYRYLKLMLSIEREHGPGDDRHAS